MSTKSIRFNQPALSFAVTGVYTTLDIKANKDFVFVGESHPFPEIVYIKSGTAEVVEDDNPYTLEKGDLIYHAANEFHRIRSAEGSEPNFYILTCCCSDVEPKELRKGVFSLNEQLQREYESIFDMLYSFNSLYHGVASGRTPTDYQVEADLLGRIGLSRLTAFLLDLPQRATQSRVLSQATGANAYRTTVRFMEQEVDKGLSLEHIANALHFSKSYITKLFSKFAGIGPMKYYARLRIERVKDMLTEGYALVDISTALSFSSPSYMSSFFKEMVGVAPTEWLKNSIHG